MDTYLAEQNDLLYSGRPPVLVAASNAAALTRAVRSVEPSGARIGARLSISEAKSRIERQAAASAVWIELDEDHGSSADELLTLVNSDVAAGRYGAVVSVSPDLIDTVAVRLDESSVELIVDADECERVVALAIAHTSCRRSMRVSDIGSDQNAERLRQLSDEVSRIASTLARLSTGPGTRTAILQKVPGAEAPPVSVEMIRSIIRARRLRARFFSEELFADPAWDMLLDLLQAEMSHLRVSVSSLCMGAAVPATTALRWLKTMVQEGLFVRCSDPLDGRRVFVELAPHASAALRNYFAEVGRIAVI